MLERYRTSANHPNVVEGLSERWLANKVQMKAEQLHPSKLRALLERLEAEGDQPVFDALNEEMETFKGNTTINRRLRAFRRTRSHRDAGKFIHEHLWMEGEVEETSEKIVVCVFCGKRDDRG